MLIIFDLDDTLIDTSGCVTPFKMRECLKKFIDLGLPIADFDFAYTELLSINAKSYRSKDALAQFLTRFGAASPELLNFALDEMIKPLPPAFSIPTTPNAKEILQKLSLNHTLAIVTGGHPPFQMEKLEKAGIDKSIFSRIDIPEDSIKKPFYERLMKEFSKSAEQVFVCGDRIAMDLIPAHELGLKTIHMRWGRGQNLQTEKWIHYAISDLSELTRILKV